MSPRKSPESQKHQGRLARPLRVSAIPIKQGTTTLYAFTAKASVLFAALSINRRSPKKDEGFQRVLSLSRVDAVTRYLAGQKAIPGAIIVSLDAAKFSEASSHLTIPAGTDVGWVIDGQHRLAGASAAAKAGVDVELPVIAFVGLELKGQIEQFVTINREAKNVPTSLYLDLLRHLPRKGADVIRARATDLATGLRQQTDSPFYERISVIGSPKSGQISLTNFVRKIQLHIAPKSGVLNSFYEQEQIKVIANYYQGLKTVFPQEFDSDDSVFFKTIGFGALWNVFPTVFSLALNHQKGFKVEDVAAIFKRVQNIDFASWTQYGSGDQAERNLAEDLRATLAIAFGTDKDAKRGTIPL